MDAIYQVHRRSFVERRVIAWIRDRTPGLGSRRSWAMEFEQLRGAAEEFGMDIRGGGTAFVSKDELCLLEWIAAVQRGLTSTVPYATPLKLADALTSCASVLNHQELRLPSPGFYRHRAIGSKAPGK